MEESETCKRLVIPSSCDRNTHSNTRTHKAYCCSLSCVTTWGRVWTRNKQKYEVERWSSRAADRKLPSHRPWLISRHDTAVSTLHTTAQHDSTTCRAEKPHAKIPRYTQRKDYAPVKDSSKQELHTATHLTNAPHKSGQRQIHWRTNKDTKTTEENATMLKYTMHNYTLCTCWSTTTTETTQQHKSTVSPTTVNYTD